MLHKCPQCERLLLPIVRCESKKREGPDNLWVCKLENMKLISAERVMHLESINYYSWRCPDCSYMSISEVNTLPHMLCTYTYREKLLRKKN